MFRLVCMCVALVIGLLASVHPANACDGCGAKARGGLLRRPVAVQKVFAERQGLLGRRAAVAAQAAPIAQSLTITQPAAPTVQYVPVPVPSAAAVQSVPQKTG